MLGILIALFVAAGIAVLTVIRRDIPLLILIAIFIMAAESGDGFTSFQGSIFFNQDALNFAKLKLIEIILYSYTGTLILLDIPRHRKLAHSPLRLLFWFWIAWLVVLLFVQFDMRGSTDISIFRGVLFGWALLYVFVSVVDSRQVMQRVITFTLVVLTAKALWIVLMFAIGRGDQTARGYSTLAWDDKLLEAFTWGLLIFFVSILQSRNDRGNWPMTVVSLCTALFFFVIALSLRRNYLGQVLIGALFVLFITRGRQIQIHRLLFFSMVATVVLGFIFTAGLVIGNRLPLVRQMTRYAELLNFSSATAFTSRPENQVHVSNVETYLTMFSEYKGIRFFGRSAAPTENFRDFNREYMSSLGLAHNGPLRAIFDFGIVGLLVWAAFFYLAFRAALRCRLGKLEPWEQAVVIGTTATVFAHFAVTLTFVPPFFTTFKILFFFLFMVYVIEFYSRESRVPEAETTSITPLLQRNRSLAER